MEWDKYNGFKKLIEDLLQKIPKDVELKRKRQEMQENAIHACIEQ